MQEDQVLTHYEMQPYIKNLLSEPGYRDPLCNTGCLSPDFNIFKVFSCQNDWKDMLTECNELILEQIEERAFLKTNHTKRITAANWPRSQKIVTVASRSAIITKD